MNLHLFQNSHTLNTFEKIKETIVDYKKAMKKWGDVKEKGKKEKDKKKRNTNAERTTKKGNHTNSSNMKKKATNNLVKYY